MDRKLTERQQLIKQVAQTIYDTPRYDLSDIRRLCLEYGKSNQYWQLASTGQRARVHRQIVRELDMANFAIERSGKALVEIKEGENA